MDADMDSYSDDDVPLASQPKALSKNSHITNGNGNGNGHAHTNGFNNSDDLSPMSEDDDVPLSQQIPLVRSNQGTPQTRAPKRKQPIKDESSSDDDAPLASSPPQRKAAAVSMPGAIEATTVHVNGNGKVKHEDVSESDDDAPLSSQVASTHTSAKPKAKRKVVKEDEEDVSFADSEEDRKIPKKSLPPKKRRKVKDESDTETEKKPAAKKGAKKVKKEDASVAEKPMLKKKGGKVKKEEDVEDAKEDQAEKKGKGRAKEPTEEEIFKWWEQGDPKEDGTQKWITLEHSGVIFPPAYEPLPVDVKMKYNGKPVDLPPSAEEVAGFYGAMIETDHAQDATFNKNFFADWLKVLEKHPPRDGTKITDFKLCDFRPMFEYFESEKAKKKALSNAEKKELKKQKDEAEAKFTFCIVDGRKEKVGNFRVEPPGLFRGRGEHPRKGCLKLRVRPEDITLNIGANATVPTPNVPGKWKSVLHDNTVTWLATWIENINGNHKYVFLAAGSTFKGQSDMQKFEKARELKNHIDRIRKDYTADLSDKMMATRQRATAVYFIDQLALRAGNEKGDDEADTVGCCSLRCEHVTMERPNFLDFDFLGKDSIRYYNRATVTDRVFKNIRKFKDNKKDEDQLFDRINPAILNKYFSGYMKGLSAKVFRTYNASITFQEQLDDGTPKDGTVQEKLNHYNHANRMVAILCNHRRTAPKTHEQSIGKMRDKVRAFKYDRMKLRHGLFATDAKYKKKKEYAEDESDIDDEWIAEHEENLRTKEIEKAEKKFAKENEKLEEDKQKPQPESVLKERLKEVEEEFKRLKKERGTKKATFKRERPVEKLEEAIQKLDEKIKTSKLQIVDREEGKEIALGTSKINYLDPRITAAWCKKYDVPIEKIFSKTLIVKFPWAMEVDDDWKF